MHEKMTIPENRQTRWLKRPLLLSLLIVTITAGFAHSQTNNPLQQQAGSEVPGKPVVYQVFTRLFGNKVTTNKPWGTIEQNGVGKFNDFTVAALQGIKELGVTHVWYTGVPHHDVITDYSDYGISTDDPDVVKGRAGSPYAVKDYYSVNPDLAVDPAKRVAEFEALIERTHQQGMKVIIDIVPNHVARNYQSLARPEGIADFGASDDTTKVYQRDNNFYYVVGETFKVPEPKNGYLPLNGESHPLADGKFAEKPAKWTGNGSRQAQPDFNDWYETVKINYGIRPDGSYDFATLPADYADRDFQEHASFWRQQDVPDSWQKFRDITAYWLAKGVDGFRFDMAEMVPVEFWSFLNSSIKMKNPAAFLLAEVYDYEKYRDYIHLGKMDYLYNKNQLYDTLKAVIQGKSSTDALVEVQEMLEDIEPHMLTFLENHDEQRIASNGFAGDAKRAKPAMVITATIGTAPTMLYFGQELGEPGNGDAGFGRETRTTIFDYWGVPAHQRWMNDGKFDGGQSTAQEKSLRDFYLRLMRYTTTAPALLGKYLGIHQLNRKHTDGYSDKVFSFIRLNDAERLVVVSNFDAQQEARFVLLLDQEIVAGLDLPDGQYRLHERLYGQVDASLNVSQGVGSIHIDLQPLESWLLEVEL